jgi:hypothetical protein
MSRVLFAIVAVVSALILGNAALTSYAVPQKGSGKGLPPYFGQIGLSKEQADKVRKTKSDYDGKIKSLNDQIKQLKEEAQKEYLKLLTDDQRKALREIYDKKAGIVPETTTTKKEETKKEEIKEKKDGK